MAKCSYSLNKGCTELAVIRDGKHLTKCANILPRVQSIVLLRKRPESRTTARSPIKTKSSGRCVVSMVTQTVRLSNCFTACPQVLCSECNKKAEGPPYTQFEQEHKKKEPGRDERSSLELQQEIRISLNFNLSRSMCLRLWLSSRLHAGMTSLLRLSLPSSQSFQNASVINSQTPWNGNGE
mmetsp:Transcript_4408/g.7290  ORF Transcript_4408/g.7290 Transcript_4408/m.7290 type:complete len:181 (+) Transcript_4408:328-870(+)